MRSAGIYILQFPRRLFTGRRNSIKTGMKYSPWPLKPWNTLPGTPNLWKYLQAYAEKHRAKGNGFGFGLVYPDSIARTLSARYYKDGSEILVWQGEGCNPRRLTPRECARLMGYPDDFRIPVSDTRAYKQFGNSVVMPVFREVARIMKPWVLAQSYKPMIADLWAGQDDSVYYHATQR